MGDKLLPCPFCGGIDTLGVVRTGSAVNGYTPYAIRCVSFDCDLAQGPVENGRAAAVEAWNRRAALSSHTSALAERDAEIAMLRAGIKRLSDEEEKLAETTDGEEFSLVSIAAQLASVEAENRQLVEETIELRREIGSLKDALEPFVAHSKANADWIGTEVTFPVHVTGWKSPERHSLTVGDFRVARAALTGAPPAAMAKVMWSLDAALAEIEKWEVGIVGRVFTVFRKEGGTCSEQRNHEKLEDCFADLKRRSMEAAIRAATKDKGFRPEEISQSEALNLGVGGRGVVE